MAHEPGRLRGGAGLLLACLLAAALLAVTHAGVGHAEVNQTAAVQTGVPEQKPDTVRAMQTRPYTFWQLMGILRNQPAFTLAFARQVLPVEFTERSRNTYFSSWESVPFRLMDQVEINRMELRIRHDTGISKMLMLYVSPDSACVTDRQVLAHFPQGEGEGEGAYKIAPPIMAFEGFLVSEGGVYYVVRQAAGKLTFGLREFGKDERDCVRSVIFDRHAD